eukprot:156708-Pyramimonas_sp.AAC.1
MASFPCRAQGGGRRRALRLRRWRARRTGGAPTPVSVRTDPYTVHTDPYTVHTDRYTVHTDRLH